MIQYKHITKCKVQIQNPKYKVEKNAKYKNAKCHRLNTKCKVQLQNTKYSIWYAKCKIQNAFFSSSSSPSPSSLFPPSCTPVPFIIWTKHARHKLQATKHNHMWSKIFTIIMKWSFNNNFSISQKFIISFLTRSRRILPRSSSGGSSTAASTRSGKVKGISPRQDSGKIKTKHDSGKTNTRTGFG